MTCAGSSRSCSRPAARRPPRPGTAACNSSTPGLSATGSSTPTRWPPCGHPPSRSSRCQSYRSEDLRKLLKACEGRDFLDLRDAVLIRLMLEPGGMRRAEITGLTVDSIDLENDVVVVMGKGRRPRAIPYGHKTGQALTRYLRVRMGHQRAKLDPDALWLSQKGALTDNGLAQMLERRCAQAGIGKIKPHQTAAYIGAHVVHRVRPATSPRQCGCSGGGPRRCCSGMPPAPPMRARRPPPANSGSGTNCDRGDGCWDSCAVRESQTAPHRRPVPDEQRAATRLGSSRLTASGRRPSSCALQQMPAVLRR